jgi:hypothetical protein
MGTLVHRSVGRIVREKGPTRKAVIQGFPGEVHYGVHGGIKDFYKVELEEAHPGSGCRENLVRYGLRLSWFSSRYGTYYEAALPFPGSWRRRGVRDDPMTTKPPLDGSP